VPGDRTHVFHKYRVRVDPDVAGIRLSPRALRDRLLEALRAEGVEAVLWQRVPLPSHPLFKDSCALAEVPLRYPNATATLDSSLIIGSQTYPLFAQPAGVVNAWADAFETVWNRLRS
jgi:dTDP-4-amino-4,6-dideoxygalactose transaminase